MKNAAFQVRRNGQPKGPGRDTFSESSLPGNLGGMDHTIEAGSLSSFKGSGRTHNPVGGWVRGFLVRLFSSVVFRDKVIGPHMTLGNLCGMKAVRRSTRPASMR